MRMTLFACFLLMPHFCNSVECDIKLTNLDALQWKNRVLIIWSSDPHHDLMVIKKQYSKEIIERHMIIFTISLSQIASNYTGLLDDQLLKIIQNEFSRDQGRYFLIGKDGLMKNNGEVLDVPSLFLQIDRMPMRKREMKEQ